jgi:6-phosphogluconolactonase
MRNAQLLIGSYTSRQTSGHTSAQTGRGLCYCEIDAAGAVRVIADLQLADPSFVAMHPHLPIAYVVNETPQASGGITRVAIDAGRGTLAVVDTISNIGHLPCHAAVAADGRRLWVTCYGSGSIVVLPLDGRGAFDGAAQVLTHAGHSQHPRRQASPHPHSTALHANGRDAYVPDLGTDRIEHYRVHADGNIERRTGIATAPGAGPRHLAFNHDGTRAYLSNELDNTLATFAIDPAGTLHGMSCSSTLPAGWSAHSAASEVAVHPKGHVVYVGNRGHDSIACFAVNGAAPPRLVAHLPSGGKHPRHFALARAADRLLIANRDSGNLVGYPLDPTTGLPAGAARVSTLPLPACVYWL